ncbi:MAG: hypothetical protein NUW37_10150 [Planctomycetes bacterium]|nr:hypothetical protein [Planctomycetota bacterium]
MSKNRNRRRNRGGGAKKDAQAGDGVAQESAEPRSESQPVEERKPKEQPRQMNSGHDNPGRGENRERREKPRDENQGAAQEAGKSKDQEHPGSRRKGNDRRGSFPKKDSGRDRRGGERRGRPDRRGGKLKGIDLDPLPEDSEFVFYVKNGLTREQNLYEMFRAGDKVARMCVHRNERGRLIPEKTHLFIDEDVCKRDTFFQGILASGSIGERETRELCSYRPKMTFVEKIADGMNWYVYGGSNENSEKAKDQPYQGPEIDLTPPLPVIPVKEKNEDDNPWKDYIPPEEMTDEERAAAEAAQTGQPDEAGGAEQPTS